MPPPSDLVVDAAPGWDLARRQAPGHAATQHTKHGVDDHPAIVPTRSTTPVCGSNEGTDSAR